MRQVALRHCISLYFLKRFRIKEITNETVSCLIAQPYSLGDLSTPHHGQVVKSKYGSYSENNTVLGFWSAKPEQRKNAGTLRSIQAAAKRRGETGSSGICAGTLYGAVLFTCTSSRIHACAEHTVRSASVLPGPIGCDSLRLDDQVRYVINCLFGTLYRA